MIDLEHSIHNMSKYHFNDNTTTMIIMCVYNYNRVCNKNMSHPIREKMYITSGDMCLYEHEQLDSYYMNNR